jgi:hypothetical protein
MLAPREARRIVVGEEALRKAPAKVERLGRDHHAGFGNWLGIGEIGRYGDGRGRL